MHPVGVNALSLATNRNPAFRTPGVSTSASSSGSPTSGPVRLGFPSAPAAGRRGPEARAGWARRTAGRCGRCGCRAATATPPSSPRTCPAAWPAPPRSTTESRVRPGPAAGAGAGSSRARLLPLVGKHFRQQTAPQRNARGRRGADRRGALLCPVRGVGVNFSPSDGAEIAYGRCLVARVLVLIP